MSKKQGSPGSMPSTTSTTREFLFSDPLDRIERPPFGSSRLGRIGSNPDRFWQMFRDFPVVKDWKVLSDSLFLVLSFALGLFWFIALVVLLAVGFSLVVIWVGVPILAATFAIVIWAAQLERSRLRVFLGVDIPSPYRYLPRTGVIWKRAWRFVRNPQLWRDTAYLLLLLPIGCLGLVTVFLPLTFLIAPVVYGTAGMHMAIGWEINSMPEAIASTLFGVILVVPVSVLINLVAKLNGEMGERFLAPTVEDVLTERVEELTESRSAVMRAMHLERRRIERDLHDGAQQRLVSLAMELGLAREKMETDLVAARRLIDESHEDAKLVLSELRDLVRGIHPAVLTDRGLDAAISAIAGRSPIPVGVDVELRDRQPDEVEGTAYFVVVEALTNVAKHSGATAANVQIRREKGWLRVTISDNGRGGANPADGSGLRGLADRIAALEGRFDLMSPPGSGTTITVEIPCA